MEPPRRNKATMAIVAALMAAELGREESWQRQQVDAFGRLAANYLVS